MALGVPDAATCQSCLEDLFDPACRFHLYPFVTCTDCGPRFTITRRTPYDRANTAMSDFELCDPCAADYADPASRRFHAEAIACPACGPRLSHPVEEIAAALDDGRIVALKGIGGFHLSVDATNEAAVMRLRERKHRYGKPLAVMLRDIEAARDVCELTSEEEELLKTLARPIVLARKKDGSGIAESVAPGIPWLGVFLPYAPLQHLLFVSDALRALVMTCANLCE